MKILPVIFTLVKIFVAWAVGWVAYMIAAMVDGSMDGIPAIIVHPIIGVVFSAIAVGFVFTVGLILKLPFLKIWWRSTWIWAGLLLFGSLFILCFGYSLGITEIVQHFETGEDIEILNPLVGLVSYFVLMFAIVNWPLPLKINEQDEISLKSPSET
ncbi:MAG: hypothetical protein ABIJ45_08760 [Candidatus Zixiibacteriota bacterium]